MTEFTKDAITTDLDEKPILDYLSKKNSHERDYRIKFYEEGHRYTVDGKEGFTSVTTWNHHHFPQFNADSIIDKMMKGKNWLIKEKNQKYWDTSTDKPKTRSDIKCGMQIEMRLRQQEQRCIMILNVTTIKFQQIIQV